MQRLERAAQNRSMTKETILIIEDDSDIVELIQYNLEREGYSVRTGRRRLRDNHPAVGWP